MPDKLIKVKSMLADLEEKPFLESVKECLESEYDPMAIVEACREGMETVGARFASQKYFVSDLICSAVLFNSAMEIIGPSLLEGNDNKNQTKVVFGTVKGDIHDIGKNLVVSMLRCNGFEVHDVGIDTPPEVFVEKVKETGAKIIGLSGLLTVAYPSMSETIEALNEAGLRNDVKVMIGGGMTDERICAQVGADAVGRDAMEAVRITRSFSGE